MKTVLTIAGSDCSGGAGIQADLKTMLANGVYGMSAITALTAQNTLGVPDVLDVPAEFLGKELDAIFTDIYPDAIKIGMVSSAAIIEMIADKLIQHKAQQIVLDPVMVATSGSKLLADRAQEALCHKLLPLAQVITPNIPEAMALTGRTIETMGDMEAVGQYLQDKYACAVLIKGGHRVQDAHDVLIEGEDITWFHGERIDNSNTHGTGCTLSSAIASHLAKGYSLKESVERAKIYLTELLRAGLDLGQGSGPLDHGAYWNGSGIKK